MNKKVKIAIIGFVVLGISGIAILKGKSIIYKIIAKKRLKKGTPKKVDWYSKMFELPDNLKF